jgi:UDP-N-acetylglucosamine acyltransferase
MNQSFVVIHADAKIGENVKIDPFTTIHEDVEIGDGTWIGSNVSIMAGTRIGKNCQIFPGAVIGAIPQDLKFENEYTTVLIGDNSTIRECVTINRGTKDKNRTEIGKNCLIMAYCHVAHDCILGDYVIMANGVQLAGHVEIGEWTIIGGTSAVLQFIKIGSHALIAGGSLVRKDVPPFIKAAREPLSYAGINSLGLKRRGFTPAEINEIQDMYRIIFNKGNNTTRAVEKIEQEIPKTRNRSLVIEFIQNSKKGILKSGALISNEEL